MAEKSAVDDYQSWYRFNGARIVTQSIYAWRTQMP